MLVGEVAALGDGGDVGTVKGEDHLEGVSGFGDVVAVGDHAEQVLHAARVAATYRPRRVVTAETSERLWSTVSDW